jgi:hypothetical protein
MFRKYLERSNVLTEQFFLPARYPYYYWEIFKFCYNHPMRKTICFHAVWSEFDYLPVVRISRRQKFGVCSAPTTLHFPNGRCVGACVPSAGYCLPVPVWVQSITCLVPLFHSNDQLEDLTRMARTPDLAGRDFLITCPSTNYVRIEARARKFSVPLSNQNFQKGN